MDTVAILHYAGPPYVGGVELTMAAHARALAADGRAARIIAGNGGAPGPGIDLRTLPELSSRGELVERVARDLAAGEVSADFHAMVDRLTAWLDDALAGAAAVMVHNVLSLHKNLAFTAALRRLHEAGRLPRTLAWCHDFAWLDPLYTPELHAGYPWDLLREPWPGICYVVVSEDRRAMLAGLLDLDPGQIVVVTPGVDLAGFLKLEPATADLVLRLGLLEAEPLLLLPARITRRKNIELAVAITGALRTLGHSARLVVTGPPGPHNPANTAYLAELLALRRESGAGDGVVFLYETFADAEGRPRPVSDAMLADLFHLADGLLFPSRYEGFGIPVLEAGLSGIRIFCSDIPPLRATAGAAAQYFGLDEPPDAIARQIAAALTADPGYALRRRVRTAYTWEAIYRRDIVPLLMGA
ncbi:MAG: glycosyltransferase family 4 protein [Chloroflexales bacterium]|nr:glycosyltransferase family 4 protein [Chloroflexales bacterium]